MREEQRFLCLFCLVEETVIKTRRVASVGDNELDRPSPIRQSASQLCSHHTRVLTSLFVSPPKMAHFHFRLCNGRTSLFVTLVELNFQAFPHTPCCFPPISLILLQRSRDCFLCEHNDLSLADLLSPQLQHTPQYQRSKILKEFLLLKLLT